MLRLAMMTVPRGREYVKIKVIIDIIKPLMRGTMMQFGDKGNGG